jgi:hypothetical protein
MLVAFASLVPGPADAQPAHRIVIVRDAETEHPIRRLAHPLFHTAGVDPALVRITLIQDRAINAFVSTGNRLSLHSGLIQSAGELAGGHPGRLPDQMRAAGEGRAAAGPLRLRAGGLAKVAAPENLLWPRN